ncbi:MAG: GAF domain-containing protein, partial [Anaerolineae bacterium]|nr:GAF domain-containing protein [Anaerolineae bacterium]
MFRNVSLRIRLLARVLGSLILVLVITEWLSSSIVRSVLMSSVQQEARNLVGERVSQIDGFFAGVGRIPVVLGNASAMDRENNEALLRARMREVVEKNPDIYGSTISFEPYTFYEDQKYFAPYYYRGGAGGTIAYVQFGSDDYVYWEWEWYTGPRDTGGLYWTLPFFDEGAGNIWMVTAAYPVIRNGEFIAVATVDVPIEDVKQNLDTLQVGTQGRVLMFDRTGGIIAASGIEGLTEGDPVTDWVAKVNSPGLAGLVERMLAGDTGIMELPDPLGQAGQMWAIYTTVPSTKWHVVTFVSVEEMLAPVTRVTLISVGISVLGLAILAALVWAISGAIAKPIGVLRDESLAIAGGDLTRRVPVKSQDEIGALGHAFNQMADKLQESLSGLEQRVAERTAKLAAAAEVSRATTSVLDPDKLQREVVELVQERFGLYYVGLFLVDEGEEYAVLRAGTGDAGREMLGRRHRLAIGGSSMIGQCVARGEARIALDVGEEAVRFDNPVLPETRSEMALPLRSRGKVIGAMSVQSTEEAAFDETDISVMQTMADQMATAIDNARLFTESQQALESTRRAYGQLSQQAWMDLLMGRTGWGYRYVKGIVLPAVGAWQPEMIAAVKAGQTVEGSEEDATLAVPIKVREQVVGVLNFRKDRKGKGWTRQERIVLESLADQLALSLESARL